MAQMSRLSLTTHQQQAGTIGGTGNCMDGFWLKFDIDGRKKDFNLSLVYCSARNEIEN